MQTFTPGSWCEALTPESSPGYCGNHFVSKSSAYFCPQGSPSSAPPPVSRSSLNLNCGHKPLPRTLSTDPTALAATNRYGLNSKPPASRTSCFRAAGTFPQLRSWLGQKFLKCSGLPLSARAPRFGWFGCFAQRCFSRSLQLHRFYSA